MKIMPSPAIIPGWVLVNIIVVEYDNLKVFWFNFVPIYLKKNIIISFVQFKLLIKP